MIKEAVIHFRWSPPAQANGELTGYKINCWYEKNGTRYRICQNVFVPSGLTEFIIPKLLINENYLFTVCKFPLLFTCKLLQILVIHVCLMLIGESIHRNWLRKRNATINGFDFGRDSHPTFDDLHGELAVVSGFG